MRSDTFERLHEEHASRLSSFLLYRTGNRALAEDLLADTCERVLRSRQRFDPRRGSERRWLYTIALNLLRDHARRQTNEERVLRHANAGSTPEASDPGLAAVEHRDELYRALAVLNDYEREALALRFGCRPEAARRGKACSARARAPLRAASIAPSAGCARTLTD